MCHCPLHTCKSRSTKLIPSLRTNEIIHDSGRALFIASLIFTAPRHCLNAHMIITSGASRARHMRKIRRFRSVQLLSSRNGTFGCTVTHVTVNVVARQLQSMSQTERPGHEQSREHSSRVKVGASYASGSAKDGTKGAALVPYRRARNKQARMRNMA